VGSSPEPLDVGDAYQLTYNLLDSGGAPADATVALTVTRPDATIETPSLLHPVLGTYIGVGACTMPGTWLYRFVATGALTDAEDGQFTVRAAAVANVYCTVGELRGQLGDDGGKLDGALLERAVGATSRGIEAYCNRRFWRDPAVKVRTYRPHDGCVAWVDDIATATGLLVKTDSNGDGTFETTWTIGTDFQLEPLNADVDAGSFAWWRLVAIGGKRFPQLWNGRPSLQVTAQFGWAAIPDGVNAAAILKATKLFRRKDSPEGWRGFADFGPVRVSRFEDPDVVALLDPLVRYSAPDR
jgi:hypothetical protein